MLFCVQHLMILSILYCIMDANTSTKENKPEYSKIKKEILRDRIEKIKNAYTLTQIYYIIKKYESEVVENATTNQNGVHMFFHNLHYDTYIKLDKFVQQIEKKQRNNLIEAMSSEDHYRNSYSCDSSDQMIPKLKYSNKEKIIIRRGEYEHGCQ